MSKTQTILEAAIQASEPPTIITEGSDPLDAPLTFQRPAGHASGGTSTMLSRQWMKRPAEERYDSLDSLGAVVRAERDRSVGRTLPLASLQPVMGRDGGIEIAIPGSRKPRTLTDWAWGQLTGVIGCPGQYLSNLPEELAIQNLQHGMSRLGSAEVQTLETASADPEGSPTLRAITSRGYGRVWDAEVLEVLSEMAGSGTGEMGWAVPTAFRQPDTLAARTARPVAVEDSTIYRGDRDMWIFLADEFRPIEHGTLPDGSPDMFFRGFAVQNSEVGAGILGITTFLYHFICANRMIWGIGKQSKIVMRHSANAPQRFRDEIIPAIQEYAVGSSHGIEEALAAAKAKIVARNDENRLSFLKSLSFSKSECEGILAEVLATTQGRPLETAWDAVEGITAYARSVPYQAERVQMERVAAKLMA